MFQVSLSARYRSFAVLPELIPVLCGEIRVCKDPSKKFCPSCGSPSLIRASVTTTGGSTPTTQIHLKQNYQYRTRGTRYAIPEPKMGRAKGQQAGGSGLILREDQKEFMTGMRREDIRRQKEERQLEKAAKAQAEGKGKGLGSWNDPDVSLPFSSSLSFLERACG
jgi:RNA-binding protein NOB1